MNEETVREFVASQRRLLELELKAEEEEERCIASSVRTGAAKGDDDDRPAHVLRNLEASDVSVGLYGRTMVTMTVVEDQKGKSELLPAHRFSVGDEVEIHSKQTKPGHRDNVGGVISTITETSLSIALFAKPMTKTTKNTDDSSDGDDFMGLDGPLSIIPKGSVEVHRKLVKALDELERHGSDHPIAGNIIRSLFGAPQSFQEAPLTVIEPFNTNLDASQLEAISFALASQERPISLIHGPPGTGKTTTVAELIQQAVHVNKYKVLVTAPSNVAVDNVLERLVVDQSLNKTKRSKRKGLSNRKLKAVRLGHPARIKASILPYSLESLVQKSDETDIVKDVRDELQSFLRILSSPKSRPADKRLAYREVKALRKEVRTREQKVVKDLVAEAQVVLATNVGAANRILDDVEFDLVVIDEAAQALEASCWIPILRGKRVVLAGDHCQLPPTIKSNTSGVQNGLGKTLFERVMEKYGDNEGTESRGTVSRMLRVQYRMHSDIANWASQALYHGRLETDDGVKNRTLAQLPHVHSQEDESGEDIGNIRLLLIDTGGCGMHETVNAAGSRYNEGEAEIVSQHVQILLAMGLKQEEIAIISPYNGQVELLRTMLLPDAPKLEIRSVDGFQGGEREAVVLSLVRSSDRGGMAGIGFLKDDRRLNVAVTRAKRHCALICDSETVSKSTFVKGLIDWMERYGVHRSAVEYLSSSHSGNVESDFVAAGKELLRLMGTSAATEVEGAAAAATKKSDGSSSARKDKPMIPSSKIIQEEERKAEDDERRKGVLDTIANFAENGHDGDELRLSSELTKYDRRVVHEFATQLGLDHRSEGVDGVDRRVILTIKKTAPSTTLDAQPEVAQANQEDSSEDFVARPLPFAAIDIDSDGSSESEYDNEEKPSEVAAPTMNQLLGSLAKERSIRQQETRKSTEASTKTTKQGGKKKRSKKGKVLGGSSKAMDRAGKQDDIPDDLDDMAFLDAQIEKVQTSHGRQVDGKGQYRSIVNGILISKGPPREEKKNTRVSSTLNARLKQAQDERRGKKANKKK